MLKLFFRSIYKSLGRYIAILAIVALGLGFFTGLRLTKTAMLYTLDEYADELRLFDFHFVSTLGLTEEDVEAARELPGVEYAEGSKAEDVLVNVGKSSDIVYHCMSVPADVDRVRLKAGRMPEKPNECLADGFTSSSERIGSEITISDNNESKTLEHFSEKKFTVVGIALSPLYINYERGGSSIGSGSVSQFFYVPEDAFSTDYYTDIYVTLSDADGQVYSEKYDKEIEAVQDTMDSFIDERVGLRYDSLYSEAKEELDDAKKTLDEKERELEDARRELADARKQLEDGQKKYDDGVSELEKKRAETYDELENARVKLTDAESGLSDAQKELDGKKKEHEEAEALVNENGKALEDAWAEYNNASEELRLKTEQGTAMLVSAQESVMKSAEALEKAKARLEKSPEDTQAVIEAEQCQKAYDNAAEMFEMIKSQAEAAMPQLLAAQKALDDAKAELEANQAEYNAALARINEGKEQVEAGQKKIDDGKAELVSGWTEYYSGKAEADEALENAQRELEDAQREIAENRGKLKDAEEEFADGEKKFADGKKEYEDAENKLDDFKKGEGYALTRDTNIGYVCFESDSDIVEGVSRVFPLFFFMVAALVCITSMTRMIDEQRTQIGVLKALGYGEGAVFALYLCYSGSASIIGCAVGSLAGSFFLPQMIWKAYNIMYGFADLLWAFDFPLVAVSSLAFIFSALAATWFACNSELSRQAAQLLRPKAPKAGRRILLERIPFIWKRLPFLHKVTFRNIMRYRRRMVMMAVGIGGCTALLLTGYGIRDSISGVIDYQYEEITEYDISISFVSGMDDIEQQEFMERHPYTAGSCLFIRNSGADCTADGITKNISAVAPKGDSIDGFVDLHDIYGNHISYPADGECVINDGLADVLGAKAGDSITLRSADGVQADFRVSGIFRNYIYNFVYLSNGGYETVFGKGDPKTAYLCVPDGEDLHRISADLSSDDTTANVDVNADQRERIAKMLTSMDYIVLVVIVCAGALAFIVLYNLTNISIIERLREIATLKVLGFYDRETGSYVFRENIILTLLGILVGFPMGIALHSYVMLQIRVDLIKFDIRILPASYLYATAFTIVFALIVNLVLRPHIRNIHMAEALKSTE